MLALIILRYKSPYRDKFRPYKVKIFLNLRKKKIIKFIQVHLSLPIIVFFISIYLVIGPIIEDPKIEYLYAIMYIVSGLLVYIPFVHYKLKCSRLISKLCIID